MPPEQILSTFPPANAEGAFGAAAADRAQASDLAVGAQPGGVPPTRGAPVTAPLARARRGRRGRGRGCRRTPVADATDAGHLDPTTTSSVGQYLDVTETVVDKIFPSEQDLPLLVHVREVDVRDTELAARRRRRLAGRRAGQPAAGVDTRRNKPVRYLACLVNLEGQLDELPPPPRPAVDFFEYELAQDWTVLHGQALAGRPARDGHAATLRSCHLPAAPTPPPRVGGATRRARHDRRRGTAVTGASDAAAPRR